MIFTSIIGCVFGSIGVGSQGPILFNNKLTLDSGIVCVATASNTSQYSAMNYEYKVEADVDFRLNSSNNEVYIHFNDMKGYLYIHANDNSNTRTLVSDSSVYSNFFESSYILEPTNHFSMTIYANLSTSISGGYIYANCFYYDHLTDEESNCSIVSPNNPLLNPNVATKPIRNIEVSFDLDNLNEQVLRAFSSSQGGFNIGYDQGYNTGYADGHDVGYNTGYSDGYSSGVSVDSTAFTIFNGILTIGMLPINVFLAMFDFTVFGINISNFVMSLLTVLVTIWVIRTITGGGKSEAA